MRPRPVIRLPSRDAGQAFHAGRAAVRLGPSIRLLVPFPQPFSTTLVHRRPGSIRTLLTRAGDLFQRYAIALS
jgi:hypothetical protein